MTADHLTNELPTARPNTPDEQRAATATVRRHARDKTDEQLLLQACGLDTPQGEA